MFELLALFYELILSLLHNLHSLQIQIYGTHVIEYSDFIVSPKFSCEVLEQAAGNHEIDVRRQNKWTKLSCPAYFDCNILTKSLKRLLPANYSSWTVNLQAY